MFTQHYENRTDLTARQRRVMVALAKGATEAGIASPSLVEVALRAGYKNKRNAQIVIRELEDLGELVVLADCGKRTILKGKPGTRYQHRNAYVLVSGRTEAGIVSDYADEIAEEYGHRVGRVRRGFERREEDRIVGGLRTKKTKVTNKAAKGLTMKIDFGVEPQSPLYKNLKALAERSSKTEAKPAPKSKPKKRGSSLTKEDRELRDGVFFPWVKSLEETFGYKLDSSLWGRERSGAWNLAKRGFTPEEVVECYVDLRKQWGSSGHISLNGIVAHIDAWKAKRGSGVAANHFVRELTEELSAEELAEIAKEFET